MEEKESVGRYLKREREIKKISLREVSKNTKVKEHILRAIEEDQFVSLPSPTYVKGFLLSYAKYIGLDPNEVILRYESSLRETSPFRAEASPERKAFWNLKYLWIIAVIIAASLISTYFLFFPSSKPPNESISKPKIEATLPSPPKGMEAPPVPEEPPFSLQLKAIEETWIRLQIDGQPPYEMTLRPGESTSHQGKKRIYLLLGNAGGIDILFQGKILEKYGKSGEVVNLIFTPQGVEKQPAGKQSPKTDSS